MKKFIGFALFAVVTVVSIHLICRLFDLGEPGDIVLWVPIAFLYMAFYGIPFTKQKEKE